MSSFLWESSNVSHQWLGFVSYIWYKSSPWCYFTHILWKHDLLNCTPLIRGRDKELKNGDPSCHISGFWVSSPVTHSTKKGNHELSCWNGKLMQGKGSFLLLFFSTLCSLILCISRWVCGESPSRVIFLSRRSALMLFKWWYLTLALISTAY